MSPAVLALVVGTALAVGAVAFVLYPLFFVTSDAPTHERSREPADDSAIVALREIEFDRATGKLSDADYAALKHAYSERAVRELRAAGAVADEPRDPIEARLRVYRMTHRECPVCGVRPEADAIYCSTCGAYVDQRCPECAATILEASAAFCSTCGAGLTTART